MKFAYADPPYPGRAVKYAREAQANGRRSREVNHPLLIAHLLQEYPDGWALSTSSSALQYVLALCPPPVRVLAWMKPFASAFRGVRPVYTWEPVVLMGGRKPALADAPLVYDSVAMAPRMVSPRQTLLPPGAKPAAFCRWVLDCLNFQPGDTLDDIFPGTGVMGDVVANYQLRLLSETA